MMGIMVMRIINGQVQYTPNTGFSGKDGFWYGISSPELELKWAYVEVTINSPIESIPLKVVGDRDTIEVNQSITVDLLANDSGTGLSLAYGGQPSQWNRLVSGITL